VNAADSAFPHVDGVEHRYVEAGGLRMHLAEAGVGPPLLLLHGWPQHWYQWRRVLPLLAAEFHLLMPDLRGFGWTDAPDGPYDKEQLASDTLALLDVLELERVPVLAHDWGGWVAFLLALRAPERMERLLALNIPHPFQRIDLRRLIATWRFWYQWLIAAPGLGEWTLMHRPGFVRFILTTDTVHRETLVPDEVEVFAQRLRQPARARASSRLYRTFTAYEFAGVAAGRYRRQRLRVPTRIVFGARDAFVSPVWLSGFEPYADDMAVELIPDAGHFIAEEKPQLVAARAREFLGSGRSRQTGTASAASDRAG
jgi:pimeloyl-ACP methyl ester carboxylesterase